VPLVSSPSLDWLDGAANGLATYADALDAPCGEEALTVRTIALDARQGEANAATNQLKASSQGHQRGDSGKGRRTRGRPPDTDAKKDQRIFDAWKTRKHPRYEDLARDLGISEKEVSKAIDRHRKRQQRQST
jgi:hypothetical protein